MKKSENFPFGFHHIPCSSAKSPNFQQITLWIWFVLHFGFGFDSHFLASLLLLLFYKVPNKVSLSFSLLYKVGLGLGLSLIWVWSFFWQRSYLTFVGLYSFVCIFEVEVLLLP